MKIPQKVSEAVNQKQTNKTIQQTSGQKKKKTKIQTILRKTLYRKLKTEQQESYKTPEVNSGAPDV